MYVVDEDDYTPIFLASLGGHLKIVNFLGNQMGDLFNTPNMVCG